MLTNYVNYLISGLIDDPSSFKVISKSVDVLDVYTIEVSEADRGKVIGKRARNLDAIRTIVKAAAWKSGRRVEVLVAGYNEKEHRVALNK